jgi:HAD superfamily hydrolase (TIGR01484 family)
MDTMPLNQSQDEKDIKLLVLDIDGTIAGQSNTLSHPVKEVIAAVQAKGIKVAIATGRMYCSALRFHQEIGSTLPLELIRELGFKIQILRKFTVIYLYLEKLPCNS